jgi:hypothetical protein
VIFCGGNLKHNKSMTMLGFGVKIVVLGSALKFCEGLLIEQKRLSPEMR